MSIKTLIDDVRRAVAAAGIKLPMARGRNLVANLLFDRNYSALIAAERDGKLARPQIVSSRTDRLRAEYGQNVDVVANIAATAIEVTATSDFEEPQMIMTTTQAVQSGRLSMYPNLTSDTIGAVSAAAQQRGDEIDWIRLHAGNVHQGQYLRFFRVGRQWYAFIDAMYDDGTAYSTAVVEGCVLHLLDQGDADDSHHFVSLVFMNGGWTLHPIEHLMVDPEDFHLSLQELTNWD
ncbi:hypothetical protein N5F13_15030 [Comamonas thiooxydans]|uniref:hypothetical protein n=1 Tax=Comamonas thiooxydans TaxID=363952 RepID=UPI002447F9AB|nr:hypothetical protein [Comamonas thiooxydans]MDH1475821.1 hypothetical protein [Comamonas thiooxydans]